MHASHRTATTSRGHPKQKQYGQIQAAGKKKVAKKANADTPNDERDSGG